MKRFLNRLLSIPMLIASVIFYLGLTSGSVAAATYVNHVDFETESSEKLPFNVGFRLLDLMENHTHSERVCRRMLEIVNGDLHEKLIDSILSSVFEKATKLTADDLQADNEVDFMVALSPIFENWWQIGLPCHTNLESYETWFKYKVVVLDRAGNQIAQIEPIGFGSVNEKDVGRDTALGITESSSQAFLHMHTNLLRFFRTQSMLDKIIAAVR